MQAAIKRSDSIDYLKAFSIIFVVLHHAVFLYNLQETSTLWSVSLALIQSVHVPLFFVIAGFLCHRQSIKAYLKKKFFRVLIPFYFFSTLKLVYTLLISSSFSHASSVPMQLFDALVKGGLYWFSYAIFLSFLFATLFWDRADAARPNHSVAIVFIVMMALNLVDVFIPFLNHPILELFQLGNTIRFIVYFLAGMLFRQYGKQLFSFLKMHRLLIASACLLVIVALSFGLGMNRIGFVFPVKFLLAFSLMFLLCGLAIRLPQNIRILKTLGTYSYQIMLLDSFFKVFLSPLLLRIVPLGILHILLLAILNMLCCCISCVIARRIPVVRQLFGL